MRVGGRFPGGCRRRRRLHRRLIVVLLRLVGFRVLDARQRPGLERERELLARDPRLHEFVRLGLLRGLLIRRLQHLLLRPEPRLLVGDRVCRRLLPLRSLLLVGERETDERGRVDGAFDLHLRRQPRRDLVERDLRRLERQLLLRRAEGDHASGQGGSRDRQAGGCRERVLHRLHERIGKDFLLQRLARGRLERRLGGFRRGFLLLVLVALRLARLLALHALGSRRGHGRERPARDTAAGGDDVCGAPRLALVRIVRARDGARRRRVQAPARGRLHGSVSPPRSAGRAGVGTNGRTADVMPPPPCPRRPARESTRARSLRRRARSSPSASRRGTACSSRSCP